MVELISTLLSLLNVICVLLYWKYTNALFIIGYLLTLALILHCCEDKEDEDD